MSKTTDDRTAEQVAGLVDELVRATAIRDEAIQHIDEIKERIQVLQPFDKGDVLHTTSGHVAAVVVRAGRRFDPMKAATLLPEPVIQQISTMQIDSRVAKLKLPRDVYDSCLSEGSLTIRMK